MTAKQLSGIFAPDGSQYITLTDGNGNLVTPGGSSLWTTITSGSLAANSSSMAFTNLSTYAMLRLSFYNVNPSAADNPIILTSTNNGLSYDTDANYGDAGTLMDSSLNFNPQFHDFNNTQIYVGLNVVSDYTGIITFFNFNKAKQMILKADTNWIDTQPALNMAEIAGIRQTTVSRNAFELKWQNGATFSSGTYILEGVVG